MKISIKEPTLLLKKLCKDKDKIFIANCQIKDLDLVLVVEALTPDFGVRLWDFIKSANYAGRSKGENEFKHEYYRFTNPADKTYPKQIELFARSTGILSLPSDAHIIVLHLSVNYRTKMDYCNGQYMTTVC